MRDPADALQATFDSFRTKLIARSGFTMPSHQFIATGQVASDCEAFFVQGMNIYQGKPHSQQSGYQETGGFQTFAFDIVVTLERCVPGPNAAGRPPTAPQLSAAALNAASDAQALTETFYLAAEDNSLTGECNIVHNAGVSWSGPQGNLLRTTLALAIEL